MNLTEHKLRLSFDPEYEAKWQELVSDRKATLRVIYKSIWTRSLLILAIWLGGMMYLLSRSWTYAIITPPIAWLVESGLYFWLSDRKKRKELGIDC